MTALTTEEENTLAASVEKKTGFVPEYQLIFCIEFQHLNLIQ